jgi:hypothetical protein
MESQIRPGEPTSGGNAAIGAAFGRRGSSIGDWFGGYFGCLRRGPAPGAVGAAWMAGGVFQVRDDLVITG